jgi:hypothetical protein
MAGDDRNPDGIEYAICQDLAEIKQVGSTDSVHFLVQTDDATGTASYRYHLRKGTDLASDRIERFNGDLNTGSTKTLLDFVQWAHYLFPAERTALVLWGHGSGHDDQNVYRAVRGSMNPRTAARLAQRRLGFFSGTRRSILEQGPTRGYGYDDTAGDFLDNGELRKALLQVKEILGRKLDILGFDACLMAMIEVAYQIHDAANILVASERTEPGDGWWYSRAFRGLRAHPGIMPRKLAGDIVRMYRYAYKDDMTLSAIDLEKVPQLAKDMSAWAEVADPSGFHHVRRSALDCSPRPGDGYCDLGSILDAASDLKDSGAKAARVARKTLNQAIIASCGSASGLTIYAPGNFRPGQAGSTDALYMGLSFVRETAWGAFLGRVYPPVEKTAPGIETLPVPTPVSGLDRYNARHVLAAVRSGAKEGWLDRLRGEVLGPCMDVVTSMAQQLDDLDPPRDAVKSPAAGKGVKSPEEERRVLILPGIMGSLLHDRSGKLGGVWIDPWNLVFGDDFDELKLRWETDRRLKTAVAPLPLPERIPDADDAVKIEAYGVIPLIYDRMALALMHELGPVVEFVPFDWRQPISHLGKGLAGRAVSTQNRSYPSEKTDCAMRVIRGMRKALRRLLIRPTWVSERKYNPPCLWSKGISRYCDFKGPDSYWSNETESCQSESFFRRYYAGARGVVWVRLSTRSRDGMPCDLDTFVRGALPGIQEPFALITTDGDASVPSDIAATTVDALLDCPWLVSWHTQNYDGHAHAKFAPFPMGIDLHTPRFCSSTRRLVTQLQGIRACRLPLDHLPLRVFCDLELSLASEERRRAVAVLRNCDHVDFLGKRMSQASIWGRYAEYPFVLSAAGNGLDCHRTWELLYLGAIVITKTSSLNRLFNGLPVVVVEDWNEVCDKGNLSKWLEEYGKLTDRKAVWDRLNPEHLVGAIRETLEPHPR